MLNAPSSLKWWSTTRSLRCWNSSLDSCIRDCMESVTKNFEGEADVTRDSGMDETKDLLEADFVHG